jgi:hypothetical protein
VPPLKKPLPVLSIRATFELLLWKTATLPDAPRWFALIAVPVPQCSA